MHSNTKIRINRSFCLEASWLLGDVMDLRIHRSLPYQALDTLALCVSWLQEDFPQHEMHSDTQASQHCKNRFKLITVRACNLF